MNQASETNKIDNLIQKVDQMFQKMSVLDSLSDKMSKFHSTLNTLVSNVDNVTKRVVEIEQSLEFLNTKYETSKQEHDTVKKDIKEIKQCYTDVSSNITHFCTDLEDLKERHIDLQTRSMRENLVFSGIPQTNPEEESEETEQILINFMKTSLKIESPVEFQRAHRFGKSDKNMRPIVCRFKTFKDREIVRKSAKELKGTKYGISEQYPKEINDRRKVLWPYFKEAKHQRKKAYLKRDKLFIDGTEFIIPDDENEQPTNRKQTKLDDLDEIQCNDFIFHHKNRKKFINKSGGIALGYKSYLESFIKPITTDCQFVLWFSIDKKVFDSPENVIFGIVYVPPENSSYSSVEAFNDIEREFHKFNENTNLICLVGDFNARTGNLRDYIEDNDTEDYFVNNVIDITELTDTKILDELCIPKHRNSPDLVVNNFGRKLVDFCKNNNVFIYNGRIGNDKAGKSTSKNLSVVDYALSTAHLLKFVKHFEVLEFSKLYSDIHSPLSLVLGEIRPECIHQNECDRNIPVRIKPWKFEKSLDFKNNIDLSRVEAVLENLDILNTNTTDIQKDSVNQVVQEISNILLESAKNSLGLTCGKQNSENSKKQPNKLWFNSDCYKARKELRRAKRLYKHYGSNVFKHRVKISEMYYKNIMDENIIKFNRDMRKKMKYMRMTPFY
ncbi:unnamed protein product [Mytilus edulis]|uniref:Endonuclease/exonuclease/phosphatase domain-containing protein n=1 Tax=Mytilus edulis TaxID=6550 RepID=A0A8S3UXV5_MYTED|nr:unnamed protein product [Mytilus edulis]